MAHTWRLRLSNRLEELPAFNAQLQSCVQQEGVDAAGAATLHMIMDELLTNIIKYGHPQDAPPLAGNRVIQVKLSLDAERHAEVEIEDDGIPFDPTTDQPRPAATGAGLSLDEQPVGGWGLRLVREMSDHLEYLRRGDHNVLRFTKTLAS